MLQHPSHSQHPLTLRDFKHVVKCRVCNCKTKPGCLAYKCEECDDLVIDVACATLLVSLQEQGKEDLVAINHLSHEHQLLSCHVEETLHIKLRCAACNQKISGQVYYCLSCSFFLHKQCADELPHEMVNYLHPEHPLVLHPNPTTYSCCCCRENYSGISFHCASCDFDLDPKCALRTSSAVRDGISTKIQYFHHDHPLLLCYYWLSKDICCKACHNEIIGLVYNCGADNYNVHRSCAEVALQLEHPLHSHSVNLVAETKDCNNCGRLSRGFTFNCIECAFDLCFKCAIERPTQKHQLHEHALSYFQNTPAKDTVMCNTCGKVDSDDFYCCTPCNFNLHRTCPSLPPTIQHECHPYHPLVLFDRFVEGLPEYQYCDLCEKLRNPDHGVYRCAREECWYTVHIGCVLPQATEHKKLYLDKLTNDIASLEGTIEVKEKDLVALKQKLEELKGEKNKILSEE